MIEKITEFFVQQSVPSAYDDSLTWYEVIAKFQAKLNEIIEFVSNTLVSKINEIIKDRNTTIKGKINESLNSLKTYLDCLKTCIDGSATNDNSIIYIMNYNTKKLIKNMENLKEEINVVSEYTIANSKTLYNGTYNCVKFNGYDENSKTLKLKQEKTDFIPALVTMEIETDLQTKAEVSNTIGEWEKPEEINTTIDEVTEWQD